jgi:hypothetical protein
VVANSRVPGFQGSYELCFLWRNYDLCFISHSRTCYLGTQKTSHHPMCWLPAESAATCHFFTILQEPLDPSSTPARLIQAAEDTNSNILQVEAGRGGMQVLFSRARPEFGGIWIWGWKPCSFSTARRNGTEGVHGEFNPATS